MDYREAAEACRKIAKLFEGLKLGEAFASQMVQADLLLANGQDALTKLHREFETEAAKVVEAKAAWAKTLQDAETRAKAITDEAERERGRILADVVQARQNAETARQQAEQQARERAQALDTREQALAQREDAAAQRDAALAAEAARLERAREDARKALAAV